MKRLFGLTTALIVAWALVPASASALIQLDRGIAGARLGNTKKQVRAALGKPRTDPERHERVRRLHRLSLRGRHPRDLPGSADGDRRGDHRPRRPHRRGFGVRSTESAVKNRVPGVSCETFEGTRICQRGEGLPGQRITAFFLKNGRVTRVIVGFVID